MGVISGVFENIASMLPLSPGTPFPVFPCPPAPPERKFSDFGQFCIPLAFYRIWLVRVRNSATFNPLLPKNRT